MVIFLSNIGYCSNCGSQLPEDRSSLFCPVCGQQLKGRATDPTIPRPHPPRPVYYSAAASETESPQFPMESPGSLFPRFFQVLFTPRTGMARVTLAPDWIIPLVICLIVGGVNVLSAVIRYYRELPFWSQYPTSGMDPSATFIAQASLALGGQLIGLVIWSVVLWLVMAVFTRLHAEDRTLKRVFSMVGYAWAPLVLAAPLNALYYFLFYHPPISGPTGSTMGLVEFMAYSMTFNLLPLILGFIFFLWSLVLLFLALSSLEIEGDRKFPIIFGYFVVGGLIFANSLFSVIIGSFLSLFT